MNNDLRLLSITTYQCNTSLNSTCVVRISDQNREWVFYLRFHTGELYFWNIDIILSPEKEPQTLSKKSKCHTDLYSEIHTK